MSTDDSGRKAVLHASVPAALAVALKQIAESQDRSVSAELRRAVSAHIAQQQQERNEA